MLWHCWLGGRKGIRPVTNGDGGGGHWLVRMEWCPAGWSVCLPQLIFPCTIKSRSSLLAPAHPRGRKRAVKRLCVCVGVLINHFRHLSWNHVKHRWIKQVISFELIQAKDGHQSIIYRYVCCMRVPGSVRRRRKNTDSLSKSNPLSRRLKNYDAST